MLTLSSCPQCRHVFPVVTGDPAATAAAAAASPHEAAARRTFDHQCAASTCYDFDNDAEDLSDDCFEWNDEDCCVMEDMADDIGAGRDSDGDGDTLVTFREHVSTKRPISNRLSLCGGGLITINQEVEPVEPITTPLEDRYNPLKFIGNPAFRYPDERFNPAPQCRDSLKRMHHNAPETLAKQGGVGEQTRRRGDSRRDSKVHVTTNSDSSQISPSMPLTFVLPVTRCHQSGGNNTNHHHHRPVSLMTQKSESGLPGSSTTDFRVVCPASTHARPLSLQINCNVIQPCSLLYLLPMQQQQLQDHSFHHDSQGELDRLEKMAKRLECSRWYYDSMTWQKSEDLLKNSAPGTFLVRNSSDPNHLYSLSVQTKNGPTSIRLSYVNGAFCLDSQRNLLQSMPKFQCVIRLIEHYIHFTLLQEKRNSNHKSNGLTSDQQDVPKNGHQQIKADNKVWMDGNGSVHSEIVLKRPLYKEVPSLKHFSRLRIHEAINTNGQPKLPLLPPGYTLLELPKILVEYLAEYPYAH